MSWTFEKVVAARYLRTKRKEGFISVIAGFSFLGIMLGVATLIIVMSVMNGFRAELLDRIIGLNGHMNVYSTVGPLYPYEPLVKKIEKLSGITMAFPTIEGQGLLTAPGHAGGVIIRGINPKDFSRKPILSTSIIRSLNKKNPFDGEYVSIGKNLAATYKIGLGSKLVLIAPKGQTTPFGTIPRSRTFIVGSIFDVGMFEYNNNFVFMSLDMAKIFFDKGLSVDAIEVITSNPDDFEEQKFLLNKEIGAEYKAADWRDTNSSLDNALKVEKNVMFLILTLIILVAAFNIISSLIMLVKDKGQDIAILRTMGATRGMIVRIFFYTGASIGVLGTAAGGALGVVFCRNIETIRHWLENMTGTDLFSAEIYFLSKLPTKIDTGETGFIILMALLLSFAATIYPAWRAARLDPVEGLRRE